MIHRAGAGPAPISQKKLNVGSLTSAIQYALSTPAQEAARRMAEQIQKEVSFLRSLFPTQCTLTMDL